MKIQLCTKFTKVNKFQKKLVHLFSDDTIKIKKCIGMCKFCTKQPVVKINGKKFKAKRISKLITKIEDH